MQFWLRGAVAIASRRERSVKADVDAPATENDYEQNDKQRDIRQSDQDQHDPEPLLNTGHVACCAFGADV